MPAMKTPLIKPSKRKEANSYKRTEQAQVEGSKTKKQWENSASIAQSSRKTQTIKTCTKTSLAERRRPVFNLWKA